MGIMIKRSFELSNVECIIGRNNDTGNFARFEKQKASLYESLILHVISNYFTALLLDTGGGRGWAMGHRIQYLFQSFRQTRETRANWHTSNFIFVAKLSKDLIIRYRASFASFLLARYLNAVSTDLYLPS